MNPALQLGQMAAVPWLTSDPRVPDTSMLPGFEKATPAAAGHVNHAGQAGHNSADDLEVRAAPAAAARQFGDQDTVADEALHATADALHEARQSSVDGLRAAVRSNPLACMTAAFALGAVIARIVGMAR